MEVSTKQEQIAALAERYPDRGLTSLNKHLDEEWLCAAFAGLRKDGAVGVEGVSAKAYGEELEKRLPDLVDRAKSGRYLAPPVRRVYIDKPGKSEKRPLGIPTTEDKLLQKAVTMLLEPIYEREFYDFSYGFEHKWLRRRHRSRNRMDWDWCNGVIRPNFPLPPRRIVHSVYRRANP